MTEALKARLLGAVVLVAVAFVALNALLGGLAPPESDGDEPVLIVRPDAGVTSPPRGDIRGVDGDRGADGGSVTPDRQGSAADQPTSATRPDATQASPDKSESMQQRPETSTSAAQADRATGTPRGEPVPAPDPKPDKTSASKPAAKPAAKPIEQPSRSEAPRQSPKPASSGRWFVQVASFGEPDNATRMIRQLRDADYSVSDERVTVNGKTYTRVVVGPYTTEQAAEGARARIAVKYGTGGRVVERG